MKVILTFRTLNYVHCVLFSHTCFSILFKIEATNLKNNYSQISQKHDQINLTNTFEFIAYFSNYGAFDGIKSFTR